MVSIKHLANENLGIIGRVLSDSHGLESALLNFNLFNCFVQDTQLNFQYFDLQNCVINFLKALYYAFRKLFSTNTFMPVFLLQAKTCSLKV